MGKAELFKRPLHLLADGIVIGIGLYLLFGGGVTYSATAILIFIVAMILMFLLYCFSNLAGLITRNVKIVLVISIICFN